MVQKFNNNLFLPLIIALGHIGCSASPRPYPPEKWDPMCPIVPRGLFGRTLVNRTRFPAMAEIEKNHPEVKRGGEWTPPQCIARQRVAIIVPLREQEKHLRGFLANMLPFLERQQQHFKIFVIEQAGEPEDDFNWAKLLNVGFSKVMEMDKGNWDCVIFSDVDTIPENDMNLYRCNFETPVHLYRTSNEFQYGKLKHAGYDRVVAFTPSQFKSINGYSNLFWGWEGADVDLYNRATKVGGFAYERPSGDRGYYSTLGDGKRLRPHEPISKACSQMLTHQAVERSPMDGLNTLDGFYKVVGLEQHKLYTKISVDLMMDKSRQQSENPCNELEADDNRSNKFKQDLDQFRS